MDLEFTPQIVQKYDTKIVLLAVDGIGGPGYVPCFADLVQPIQEQQSSYMPMSRVMSAVPETLGLWLSPLATRRMSSAPHQATCGRGVPRR